MRVIAGSCGGARLTVPKSVTRPTSDRVREALFSILGDRVRGAMVLDLFAGSGALGIEALSRGAAGAVFLEQNSSAAEVVRTNLASTGLAGGRVVRGDVLSFLKRWDRGAEFDIVFADPPYVKRPGDRDFGAALLASSPGGVRGVLRPSGVFVLESDASHSHGQAPGWQELDRREYGGTALSFFLPDPGCGEDG